MNETAEKRDFVESDSFAHFLKKLYDTSKKTIFNAFYAVDGDKEMVQVLTCCKKSGIMGIIDINVSGDSLKTLVADVMKQLDARF